MAWTSKTTDSGVVILSEEATADSDKLLVQGDFPSIVGIQIRALAIIGLRIEYTATATVGTRLLRVQLRDSVDADVLMDFRPSGTGLDIVASATKTVEFLIPGSAPSAPLAGVASDYYVAVPNILLAAGLELRIFDTAAIAADADTMIVHVRGITL